MCVYKSLFFNETGNFPYANESIFKRGFTILFRSVEDDNAVCMFKKIILTHYLNNESQYFKIPNVVISNYVLKQARSIA